MASVQTWILSKSKNRRGGHSKRNSGRQIALDGSRTRFSKEVQGKLRNTMRKPKNGSAEGKDRLRALAAAAARAAGANLTTYFADDDQRPVNPDGPAATTPPIKLVSATVGMSGTGSPAAQFTAGSSASAFAPASASLDAAALGGGSPAGPLRFGQPEGAELQAKHAARAARLVTSGDGFLTHMETSRSTSGELPPQLGPPAPPGQPNLEFLPVLPPMHVHSHPVTTGQGPPQAPAPAAYVRPNRDSAQAVVPKIVLSRASSAGAAAGQLPELDRARSGSGGLPGSIGVPPLHPQQRNCPIPQVTISLKRDLSPAAAPGDEEAWALGDGASMAGSRGRGTGLPPIGAKVTGRRGKRGGGPSPDRGSPHQRWSALSRAASDGSFPAATGQPQFPPQPPHLPTVAIGEQAPSAMPKIPLEQNNAVQQPQPQDEVMLESEAAGGDVPMEQGTSGQEDGPVGQPAVVSIAESGRAPSFSPFSVAPPVGESSSDSSDTESDQSRDKQAREGETQGDKRPGSPGADAGEGRAVKKMRGQDGLPRAARAASLGTVIAAVEERATRQGSGAMDAAIGSAPTTVEDCLQSSSFGNVRKSKRSAKPPREEGAPLRVWGSVGGPLAPSSAEGQEAMAGIGSLSLEEQNSRRVRAALPPVSAAAAAPAAGRSGLALSSSESAAAISLLALAPQTPPSVSSPSAAPVHHDSGELEEAAGAAAAAAGAPDPAAIAAPAEQRAPMQISGNVAAAEGTSQRAGKETNGGADHAQTWAGGSGGSLPGGSAGGNGAAGGSANGIDRAGSAGLPITPLRLDSGLQDPNGTTNDMAMGLWSGKLKHRMATQGGYSTVDLLNLTALIPDRYLEQLPPTLFVTELVARGAVQMSKHYIVQCRLGFLTDRQLTKLQLLANSKLVAVCQLQHCKLTLVPYIEARSGQLRIMGFLIADDLGT